MADVGAVSAGLMYAAAMIILLGVRSWQQYRATGTAGFNGFRRGSGAAARLAGAGFVLALLVGALSPILIWLDVAPVIWPASDGARLLAIVGGAVVFLAGVGLAIAAQAMMGTSWRIGVDSDERTELVTHGLFAAIRNPIFTALLIIQCGAVLMAPTWVAIVGVGVLLFALHVQVRLVEEPYLLATHQNSYPGYAAQTGRFVPRIGRLHHVKTRPKTSTPGRDNP